MTDRHAPQDEPLQVFLLALAAPQNPRVLARPPWPPCLSPASAADMKDDGIPINEISPDLMNLKACK